MSVMDKFLNYMKLNGEEDDEYDEDDYMDDEEDIAPVPAPRRSSKQSKAVTADEDYEERPAMRRQSVSTNKITPIKQPASRRVAGRSGMEVCVIKPVSVEDSREITETLLADRTVVLNLEGLDVDIAQRIIDFTSGSCFAIQGSLQKISRYIFIITPSSVDISGDISGDFQDILGDASFEGTLQ